MSITVCRACRDYKTMPEPLGLDLLMAVSWELSLIPLQEQQMLSTAEPVLQPWLACA